MKKWKYFLLYFIFLVIYSNIFIELKKSFSLNEPQKVEKKGNSGESEIKYILLWNTFWGSDTWAFPKLVYYKNYFEDINCPEKRCRVIPVNMRNIKPVEDYDAIVFHGTELKQFADQPIPTKRNPNQIYVYATVESPRNYWKNLTNYKNFFNYTMTYRLDSDSHWFYLQIRDIKTGSIVSPRKHVKWRKYDPSNYRESKKAKTLLASKLKKNYLVWIVSHCNAPSKRDQLFDQLKIYLKKVDKYGRCGIACDDNQTCLLFDIHYKFYASFENMMCNDYVTEKLLRPFDRNIIPVVYGGSNYSRYAPPKSYIDANSFADVKSLAEFLNNLGRDSKEYLTYFWWKEHYKVEKFEDPFCELCHKLHHGRIQKRTTIYKDIFRWWTNRICRDNPTIKIPM